MTGDRVPLPPDLDACPLLGLPNDPSTHFAFAHRAHLCHATPRPASIDVTYQARFCLTAGFPACDRYRTWAAGVAATSGPPPEPEMVGVMESVAARAAAAQETAAPVIQPAAEATLTPDVAFAPLTGSVAPAGSASPTVALAASSLAEPPMAEPVIAEPLIEQPAVPDPTVAVPAIAEAEVAEPLIAEPLIAEPLIGEPLIAEPLIGEPLIADPLVGEPLFPQPTAERRLAEPTLAAPLIPEPVIAEPPVAEAAASHPILAAPGVPEAQIVKPPIAQPRMVPPVDRPAAWRSLAAAVERLSAARSKPTPVEPLSSAMASASDEPRDELLPAVTSMAASVEAPLVATSMAPPVEPLSPPLPTEPTAETLSAATTDPQADLLPAPASSPSEPAESTWVAVPMATTSSAATSIEDPIDSFLAASRAPIDPPSAPRLIPIPVADEDDDDHVADDAQGIEPPTDFDVWSTPEEEVAAEDESAPWSPVGDGSGSAPPNRLAALNVWPAIQPLSSPEPKPAPPPSQRTLTGDDAWPPAPSLTSRSAGAATAFAAAVPAVPRSSLAATTGTAASARRSTSVGPSSPAARPAAVPTEPVRPTLDAAALRRTRLPLLVVLLAIAIIAGFAAGPWALRQLTGGDAPMPSAAGGVLASAAPSAKATVPATPAASAAASAAATPLSSPQPSVRPAFYIVQKGDSLGSIAGRFGTTVQRLMDLNHISNPNRIVVGQKILLPTN